MPDGDDVVPDADGDLEMTRDRQRGDATAVPPEQLLDVAAIEDRDRPAGVRLLAHGDHARRARQDEQVLHARERSAAALAGSVGIDDQAHARSRRRRRRPRHPASPIQPVRASMPPAIAAADVDPLDGVGRSPGPLRARQRGRDPRAEVVDLGQRDRGGRDLARRACWRRSVAVESAGWGTRLVPGGHPRRPGGPRRPRPASGRALGRAEARHRRRRSRAARPGAPPTYPFRST